MDVLQREGQRNQRELGNERREGQRLLLAIQLVARVQARALPGSESLS